MINHFEIWTLEFVRRINLSYRQNIHILVCIVYVTKWIEAEELPWETEQATSYFLYVEIFTRFGIPREIVTDGGSQFTSKLIKSLIQKYHIKNIVTSPYHPQDNRKLEGTNRVLEYPHTNNVQLHQRDWDDRLLEGLWVYKTKLRGTTGLTPYQLVYGKKVTLPIEVEIKTLRIALQLGMDLSQSLHNLLQ